MGVVQNKIDIAELEEGVKEATLIRRSCTKEVTIAANSYAGSTVTKDDLGVLDDERIYIVSAHQSYATSSGGINLGLILTYNVNEDNQSIAVGLYNSTSAERTYKIKFETMCGSNKR